MARAPFKPTPALRQRVRQLAVVGLPQEDIATLVECSAKTLRKHFRKELDQGSAEANALVAGFLFQTAKGGNVAAQIFWLKTRARWVPPLSLPADAEAVMTESAESDARIIENLMARMRQAEGAGRAVPADDTAATGAVEDQHRTQIGDDDGEPV